MAEEKEFQEYPKWIDHPTENKGMTKDNKRIPERILVKDAAEEAKHYPKVKPADKSEEIKHSEAPKIDKKNWKD